MYRADATSEESETIVACRICLETEGRLQRIKSREVIGAYRNLTGEQWDTSDKLPQHVCWECKARLGAAMRLRRRALASHSLMHHILTLQPSVTSSDIHLEDRHLRSLKSNLRTMHFTPNEYLAGTNNIYTKHDKGTNTDDDGEYPGARDCSFQTGTKTYRNRKLDAIKNARSNYSATDNSEIDNNIEHAVSKVDVNAAKNETSAHVNNNNLQIVAVDGLMAKTTRRDSYDSDSSEENLVIDDHESLETIVKSEYVGKSEGGMPIDELINIYNSNGDGDGKLQELNEQFDGEATVQVDQGWGAQSDVWGKFRLRAVRSGFETNVKICKGYHISRAYMKLNQDLFTFTPMSEKEQIEEIAQRQYSLLFKEGPFKCFACFRSFASTRAYEAHIKRHTSIRGAYECRICKLRLKNKTTLRVHVGSHHTVKISCNGCDFVTMNRFKAQRHEKWHEGNVHQCPHCPKRFEHESTYKSHLRTRHMRTMSCALCGATLLADEELAHHRSHVHPDADQVPLRGPCCARCDVLFATRAAYGRHLALSSRHGPDYSSTAALDVKPRNRRY